MYQAQFQLLRISPHGAYIQKRRDDNTKMNKEMQFDKNSEETVIRVKWQRTAGNTEEIALGTDVREERAFELKSECKESNLLQGITLMIRGERTHAEGTASEKKAVG